jgi:hypothetical protein
MFTKKIWRSDVGDTAEERRGEGRVPADFYAVEIAGGARYLRRVTNVSEEGLRIENPLADEQPGQTVELELPTDDGAVRVSGEVVHTSADGHVGVRITSAPLDVENLGGRVPL